LADAGEEVVSGFHDEHHYLAEAMALQAVRESAAVDDRRIRHMATSRENATARGAIRVVHDPLRTYRVQPCLQRRCR
jgi:hypothetical protein